MSKARASMNLNELENIALFDIEDIKNMLRLYPFETVERELIRALVTLDYLKLELVDCYNEVINE